MKRLKTFISLDDTDEVGYSYSTGMICEEIKEHIISSYNVKTEPITRHQLFIHDDIPYTSHNSSMCFATLLSEDEKEDAKQFIIEYIRKISAPSSSPGVCVGVEDEINNIDTLIQYGFDAKNRVLTKNDAYKIASEQNLFLFEFKNGGRGIIGAVAGLALRMYGSDGRIKGMIHIGKEQITAKELLRNEFIDDIRLEEGQSIPGDALIVLSSQKLKTVYINHRSILLVEKKGGFYYPLGRKKFKHY